MQVELWLLIPMSVFAFGGAVAGLSLAWHLVSEEVHWRRSMRLWPWR